MNAPRPGNPKPSPPAPGRRRPDGFTLVELLVVVAIIAGLGGIVYAVARPMVAKSREAACLNQLRSIGVGLGSYLADHNQVLPDIAAARASNSEDIETLDTVLASYLGAADAFRCPEDREQFDKTGSSYYWNSTQSGKHVTRLSFFGIDDRPERIPLVTDKEAWHPAGSNFLYADYSATSQVRFATGNSGR